MNTNEWDISAWLAQGNRPTVLAHGETQTKKGVSWDWRKIQDKAVQRNDRRYRGKVCDACNGNERYTANGRCTQCYIRNATR